MVRSLKRGIVDTSSVIWTTLFAGKDTEFGRKVLNEDGKEVFVNSANYGYENAINHLCKAIEDIGLVPSQLIFVIEGKNGKAARRSLHEGYGGGRDKTPEHYEEFTKVRDMLVAQFKALGSQFVTQDGVEADDVIAYVAQNLEGYRYIISGDKDLAAQVGPGPRDRLLIRGGGHDTTKGRGIDDSAWSGYIHLYRQGMVDQNPFGPFEHRWINVAIALVGDASDKIPGATRFGEKSFEELLIAFGDEGLAQMDMLIRTRRLDRLSEDVAELKVLQRIIDSAQQVYMSYELARPWVERVNTRDCPLHWTAGMVLPRSADTDERLRKYAGQVSIVSAENYESTLHWIHRQLTLSPHVSLDIETATPPESDAWLEALGKTEDRTPVDVFGSELVSLQLTFGPNGQYTAYFPVRNREVEGCTNLSIQQVRDVVALVPRQCINYVHNNSFELPVLYGAWGEDWKDDPDWHGFLPNVMDTQIGASYVDENEAAGLKKLSARLLGYKQVDYATVTTKEMAKADWDGQGKLLAEYTEQIGTGVFEKGEPIEWQTVDSVDEQGQEVSVQMPVAWAQGPETMTDGRQMVRVQYKMDGLTAQEVLSYGADDTICTLALANHFRVIMEIENTWQVYCQVEQLPAYVTASAFVHGVDFSLQDMREMEKADDKAYDENWAVLRDYLIEIGFDGTRPPVYTALDAPAIKEAFQIVTGAELKTLVRTPDKLVKLIQQKVEEGEFDDTASNFAAIVASVIKGETTVESFNTFVASKFSGEPKVDLGSSKQMTALLYDRMKAPVRIVNKITDNEKTKKPELDLALRKFQKMRSGSENVWLEPTDLELIRTKAKADDTAIETALKFDAEVLGEEACTALRALLKLKTIQTRRALFYANYWNVPHWKDGKIHASTKQCAAVTRRYSMTNPNLQQLPKKGEGVKFRGCFKPHHKNAVICSIDFSGQELRLAAERSQDKNLLACYVGDNLKDVHSLTAAFAMKLKWGEAEVVRIRAEGGEVPVGMTADEWDYELFCKLRAKGKADPWGKKADDLRKESKNVNFTAQFGGSAPKISETLIMPLEDARLFLEARSAMFPDVDVAAERAAEECTRLGYAMTLMGARRHLRDYITSFDSQVSARAARQAWNFEIQGSAGEMTKLAMARLWASGALHRFDVVFIAPIHDELVVSVHKDHAVEFIKIMHECMTMPYSTMQVPILGSISIGPDFADQHECGDWFIAENIREALDKIFRKDEKVAA